MEPEKNLLEKEKHLQTNNVWVSMLVFWGVISLLFTIYGRWFQTVCHGDSLVLQDPSERILGRFLGSFHTSWKGIWSTRDLPTKTNPRNWFIGLVLWKSMDPQTFWGCQVLTIIDPYY